MIEIENIKKWTLAKEDIVVITCKDVLSDEQVAMIRHDIKKHIPDNKILLLEGGLELSIITEEINEKRM